MSRSTILPAFTGTNAPQPPRPLTPEEIAAFLDYAGTGLIERRDALIEALHAATEAYPVIENDEVLGEVAENTKMSALLGRTSRERHDEHKAPFLAGGRVVDKWFHDFMTPLAAAMAPVQAAMNRYGEKKLADQRRIAAEVRAKAQAEADRLAEIAARDMRARRNSDESLKAAAKAEAVAESATRAENARPADMTRTRGDYGAVASVRETWSWKVVSLKAVPWPYLMINETAVKEAARARDESGKPIAVIPGIEWVSTTKVGVR